MLNEQQTQFLSVLAQGLSRPGRTPILERPSDHGMPYEEVYFPASDGVTLNGWFIPADSDRVVICNHFSPANRYGFPGHMEPWTHSGGFEVNFLPRYKALHNAGYNILAYDIRNHGLSDDAAGGITGVGYMEWRDVVGSIDYIKNRADTQNMDISMISMCMGCNATFRAMKLRPYAFNDVKSLIAIQPLNGRTSIERACEKFSIDPDEGVLAFEPIYNGMTGFRVDDHDMSRYIKHIKVPTFLVQVRNDTNSRASDIQSMFDNLEIEDKKLLFIEGTPWRFHGYTYFSEKPAQMLDWLNAHS